MSKTEEQFEKEMMPLFEQEMMALVAMDPELGFHRSTRYPSLLINPWTGKIKKLKTGRVITGTKYRGKAINKMIWDHYNPHARLMPGQFLLYKDRNRTNNSITNLIVGSRSDALSNRMPYVHKKQVEREISLEGYEPLSGCPNYLINPDRGTVIHKKHKILLGGKVGRYRVLTVRHGQTHKTFYLHRLVWCHSYGDIPEGWEVDHIDCDPENNSILNLQCLAKEAHKKKTCRDRLRRSREDVVLKQSRQLLLELEEKRLIEEMDKKDEEESDAEVARILTEFQRRHERDSENNRIQVVLRDRSNNCSSDDSDSDSDSESETLLDLSCPVEDLEDMLSRYENYSPELSDLVSNIRKHVLAHQK